MQKASLVTRVTPTLSVYLGWHFILAFVGLLAVISGLILLFDTIELMRRAVGDENLAFGTVLGMALLKMPHTVQAVLPFTVMIAMMFALFRLSRSHELVVMRSAGVSVWQFLAPALILAGLLGILNLAAIDPLAATMYESYQRMDQTLLRKNAASLNIGKAGLWLREERDNRGIVVHAATVRQDGGTLQLNDVSIFRTDASEKLEGRYNAENGQLTGGQFHLQNVWDMVPGRPPVFRDSLDLPTAITFQQVENSFAPPETLSFWELPAFIKFSRASGFSALPHRLYWHSLLATPFLLCAMVLVASVFFLTSNARLAGWTARGIAGVSTGFLFYFFSRFTYALGLSATLPLMLAAWAPTAVAGLLGLAYLFHREDG
ncbi:MAG: LPS export ABC transporter permease LptG [Proteobacteria bacterium]|nr:LPS export ABC transporter permease LptG [Pseudomonadota bacterium]